MRLKKDIFKNRIVLVTGASTGIGLALVNKLIQQEFRVVATARQESLHRFQKEGIHDSPLVKILPLDVTNLKQQQELYQTVCKLWGGVDILINNAGISYRAVTEQTAFVDDCDQFETNYFGPMNLTRLFLPKMRENRYGHIINISSVGGMMAMPTMGNYSASKFALEGASEALWYEMRPWGIRVMIIEPGFVNSNAFRKVRLTQKSKESIENSLDSYHKYYLYMTRFITRMMENSPSDPDKIANQIIRVIVRSSFRLRVPCTPDAWFFYILRRLLPSRFYHFVLYRLLPYIDQWVP